MEFRAPIIWLEPRDRCTVDFCSWVSKSHYIPIVGFRDSPAQQVVGFHACVDEGVPEGSVEKDPVKQECLGVGGNRRGELLWRPQDFAGSSQVFLFPPKQLCCFS
jgi:hypothetical protein